MRLIRSRVGANWVANLIALEQAVNKVGVTKIITFHSRVSNAEAFASEGPQGINQYLPDFRVEHVNGSQNTADRNALIKAFADAPKGAITNARCLTEGVNIPAVDMVAFIEPRQSKVDIVQAVGRAMRKPRGETSKTRGYVLVPLFAGTDGKGFDEAIKSEKFDAIADVLNALREHDEDLVDIIRELKQAKGEGKRFNPERLAEKLEFIGPTVELETLSQSIALQVVDTLGASWDESYGYLLRFYEREGHCNVPDVHLEAGYRLAGWIHHLRARRDRLNPNQIAKLDYLGFTWDPRADRWEKGFQALCQYKQREKNCLVPLSYHEGNFHLGNWVANQRKRKTKLTNNQKKRLDEIGFIWDANSYYWEAGLKALTQFKSYHGHLLVPLRHEENGFKLGEWVNRRRAKKAQLTAARIKQLNDLGFVWQARKEQNADQWELGFLTLKQYVSRENHCLVPQNHIENKFKLGFWVANQRSRKATLTSSQQKRLKKIG